MSSMTAHIFQRGTCPLALTAGDVGPADSHLTVVSNIATFGATVKTSFGGKADDIFCSKVPERLKVG